MRLKPLVLTGLLLFGLLAAGTAAAQGLKAPLPQAVPEAACSAQERAVIEAAFRDALAMTRLSIQRLDTEPNLPEFQRWFGTAPRAQVRRNLELIAQHLATRRPSTLLCNPPDACPPGRFAFVRPAGGEMGFCRLFFSARNEGLDSRPGIIVHEISHLAARTRDIVYSPTRAAILAKDDPASAAVNADNYEYFVETAGAGALPQASQRPR
jgi:hypothetical protein